MSEATATGVAVERLEVSAYALAAGVLAWELKRRFDAMN